MVSSYSRSENLVVILAGLDYIGVIEFGHYLIATKTVSPILYGNISLNAELHDFELVLHAYHSIFEEKIEIYFSFFNTLVNGYIFYEVFNSFLIYIYYNNNMRKSTFEVPKIMSLGDNSSNEGLGRLFTAVCAPGKY